MGEVLQFCIFLIFLYQANILESKPVLSIDDFFNYTEFYSLTFSPLDNQLILTQTRVKLWEKNINEYHLHLHYLASGRKELISTNSSSSFVPIWYDQWIGYIVDSNAENDPFYLNLYSTTAQRTYSFSIGNEPIHAFTWSHDGRFIYFAQRSLLPDDIREMHQNHWKGVIEHRAHERGDTIFRVDIQNIDNPFIEPIATMQIRVSELLTSSDGHQLIFSSTSKAETFDHIEDFEIYSLNLERASSEAPMRLTKNQAIETNLQWFNGSIFFTVIGAGSIEGNYKDTQGRLYSLNINNLQIERWAHDFEGTIKSYTFAWHPHPKIIILGQWRTEVQVYVQEQSNGSLDRIEGWPGTYQMLITHPNPRYETVAFIHSSFDVPQEIYISDSIADLNKAKQVTQMNKLFTERNLPKGTTYLWTNEDDQTQIEGILLYPPDKFKAKNLPLLVLIHGGPYDDADLNFFQADWYYCASLMATDGWLVFQPNYRGTGGYGDRFLNELLLGMVSLPAKDIMFGVDALLRDGIADATKLTIGGYSYGGYLTNWIITQTTRFNAAISAAGGVETVSDWGTNDEPFTNAYYLGGMPWEVPNRYQQEASIFQMTKVRTPTLILTPENDKRVPTSQSYILERALRYLNVPTKLIIFPDEEHLLSAKPWNEKIKLREELKWLRDYGYNGRNLSNNNDYTHAIVLQH